MFKLNLTDKLMKKQNLTAHSFIFIENIIERHKALQEAHSFIIHREHNGKTQDKLIGRFADKFEERADIIIFRASHMLGLAVETDTAADPPVQAEAERWSASDRSSTPTLPCPLEFSPPPFPS